LPSVSLSKTYSVIPLLPVSTPSFILAGACAIAECMEEQATSRIPASIDAAKAAGVRRLVIFMVAPFRVEVELREGKRNAIAFYSIYSEIFYRRRGNVSG